MNYIKNRKSVIHLLISNAFKYISESFTWRQTIFLGVFLRLLIFLIICFMPIPYGPIPPISPFHYQTGVDLGAYLDAITLFTSMDGFLKLSSVYYETLFLGLHPDIRPVGPIYPLLLYLFEYRPQNTLGFSLLIFFLEVASFLIWCLIEKKRASGFTGLAFAFMPHIIWFGILVSTDIFAYFFSSILFGLFFLGGKKLRLVPIVCILLICTRPTGIILCLVTLFTSSKIFRTPLQELSLKSIVLLIMIIGTLYYIPYHLIDQYLIDTKEEFRGIARTNFLIYPFIKKFFAVFGFHSSESGLLLAEIVRALYGVIFVIGFFVILFTKSFFKLPLIVLFGFILFYHVPSWRYMLPFLPLLFLYGGKATEDYLKKKLQ